MLASIPLLVTFSLGALAQPAWGPWGNGHGAPDCLNDAKVKTILDGYTYLLESPQGADFNTTAESLLSDSFFVSSDSINTLAGYPVCHFPRRLTMTNRTLARRQRLPKQAGLHRWPGPNTTHSCPSNPRIIL